MEKINTYTERITNLAVDFAPKAILASILLIIGWFSIRQISKFARTSLSRSKVNKELQPFIISFVSIGFKILLITIAAGIVGIETASFTALIAATGFAIGLAMQGNLSNFASGILILFFRPFKIGDELKIQGFWAFVKEIQIFHTVLEQFDKTEVIIPNSIIMSGTIHNLSSTPDRSITVVLKIPFEEDVKKVIHILKEAVYSRPEIDKKARPFIRITDFETHYIEVIVAFPTIQEGYWSTDYEVRMAVIDTFAKHRIKVTYPEGADFGEFGKFSNTEQQN